MKKIDTGRKLDELLLEQITKVMTEEQHYSDKILDDLKNSYGWSEESYSSERFLSKVYKISDKEDRYGSFKANANEEYFTINFDDRGRYLIINTGFIEVGDIDCRGLNSAEVNDRIDNIIKNYLRKTRGSVVENDGDLTDNSGNQKKLKVMRELIANHNWHSYYSKNQTLYKEYTVYDKKLSQIKFLLNFENEDHISILVNGKEIGKVLLQNFATTNLIDLRITMHIQKYIKSNFNVDQGDAVTEELKEEIDFETLVEKLEVSFRKYFPNGGFVSKKQSLGGAGISVAVSLTPKEDWPNGIIHNDPMYTIFSVTEISDDLIEVELTHGGRLTVNPPEDKKVMYAMVPLKIPFRKLKGSQEKVVAGLDAYFKKMKSAVLENGSEIYGRSRIPDKYFDLQESLEVEEDLYELNDEMNESELFHKSLTATELLNVSGSIGKYTDSGDITLKVNGRNSFTLVLNNKEILDVPVISKIFGSIKIKEDQELKPAENDYEDMECVYENSPLGKIFNKIENGKPVFYVERDGNLIDKRFTDKSSALKFIKSMKK